MLPTLPPSVENLTKAVLGAFLIPFAAYYDVVIRLYDSNEPANLTGTLISNIRNNMNKEMT